MCCHTIGIYYRIIVLDIFLNILCIIHYMYIIMIYFRKIIVIVFADLRARIAKSGAKYERCEHINENIKYFIQTFLHAFQHSYRS